MHPTPKAIAHLKKSDPVLGRVISKVKLPRRTRRENYFYALVRAIIGQQLSGKAADSIERKFTALFGGGEFPSPERVLKMPVSKMRSAGLSGSKAEYIKNLAKAVHEKKLDLQNIEKLTDSEIIAALVAIKGIGQWTAEMFLMFALGRPDVFSYGDLGLRNALERLYKLRQHPSKKTAEKIAAKWSPHRTLACRYLWASFEIDLK